MNYDEYVASIEKTLDSFLTKYKFNLKKLKNQVFKEYMLQYMHKINNGEQEFVENITMEVANFFNISLSKTNNCLSSVKNWAIKKGYIDKSPRNDVNKLTAIMIVKLLKECDIIKEEENGDN